MALKVRSKVIDNVKEKPKKAKEKESNVIPFKKKGEEKVDSKPDIDAVRASLYQNYSRAMDQTEKQYNITSQELYIPDKMSTGLLCADVMMGGGIAGGIMYQVSGLEGAGKCLVSNTIINNSTGFVELGEEIADDLIGFQEETRMKVLTEKGIKKVSHLYRQEVSKTFNVKTFNGFELEGTLVHRVKIIDSNLNFVWKKLRELQVGDWIVTKSSNYSPLFGKNKVSKELATIMGYLTANGKEGRLSSYDKEVVSNFISSVKKVTGHNPSVINKSDGSVAYYNIISGGKGSFYKKVLKPLGYSGNKSKYKCIPYSIRTAPQEILHEFLESYFECDSGINKNAIEITTASKKLARQLHILLFNIYDILATKSVDLKSASNSRNPTLRHYYTLSITAEDAIKFLDTFKRAKVQKYSERFYKKSNSGGNRKRTIPYVRSLVKNAYLNARVSTKKGNSSVISPYNGEIYKNYWQPTFISVSASGYSNNHYASNKLFNETDWKNFLPHLSKIDKELASKIDFIKNSGFSYEEVIEVKEINKKVFVYDLSVPETKSFISNGLVSHNTTFASTVLGSAIRSGIPVVTDWDAENAMSDPVYAKACTGFDPNEIFYGPNRRARLYQEAVLEDFYNSTKNLMRRLPDKIYRRSADQWFFVFDADKEGRAKMAEWGYTKYNKQLYQDSGRLWCEVEVPGKQGFIVCDSYPALITTLVDENDDQKILPAMNARAFADNIRKVVGVMKRKGFTILGVNQIRTNPMPAYGCVHGETVVPLVDGRNVTMRDLVENQIEGEVWSYNEDTDVIEPRKIIKWFNNGKVKVKEDWISFKTSAVDTDNGVIGFTLTPDHKVLTDKGWKKANKLQIGDKLLSKYDSIVNGTFEEFLYGTLIGDSCLVADSENIAHLRLRDSNNIDYVNWKKEKLQNGLSFKEWKHGIWASNRTFELKGIKDLVQDRNPVSIKDGLSILSMAVHYMDDGTLNVNNGAIISFKRFKNNVYVMNKILEIYNSFDLLGKIRQISGDIAILGDKADIFFEKIRKYIPDCMQYKLPEKHRGFYKDFKLKNKKEIKNHWVEITEISIGSDRKFRMKDKYDIEVEGNHNYLVGNPRNGVIMHNSPPEYEPGGNALKFYSSCRIQSRPRGLPEEMSNFSGVLASGSKTKRFGQEPSVYGRGVDKYHYVNVVNTKNKLGTPGIQFTLRIWFKDGRGTPHGFDYAYDTYQYMDATGQISGSFKKASGFKINMPEFADWPSLDWHEFKLLSLAYYDPLIMARAKEKFENVKKIPDLRAILFKQVRKGKYKDMLNEGFKSKPEDDLEGPDAD